MRRMSAVVLAFLARRFSPGDYHCHEQVCAMKRLAVLLLSLLFFGCGNSGFGASGSDVIVDAPVSGRSLLAINSGNDVVAATDALPPQESGLIYATVVNWNDSNVPLTGTADAAFGAVATIVRDPDFGAHSLYLILDRLAPDNGQGFVSTFGQTLSSTPDSPDARAQDALTALLSQTSVVAQNVEPIIEQNLPPEISSIQEFHGLRILDPSFLPTAKRDAMIAVRNTVPDAQNGETIRKILMLSDMQNYLDGTFDPEVGGSVAQLDQTDFLVTPAQFIAGLRLDYPGGFAGQTQVASLTFPKNVDFDLAIPFVPAMGGTATGNVYPFTGTGFTSNVQAQAIPEFVMGGTSRTPLPVGSQLFLIAEDGTATLQGTLNAQGMWTLNGRTLSRDTGFPRQIVRRHAVYRGVPIWVSSTDGEEYWVASEGVPLPDGFFREISQIGPLEYLGRVSVDDPELLFGE